MAMKRWRDELLWRCALRRIRRSNPTVIAVGGGIAKTSTKQAVGAVLAEQSPDQVFVGYGNLNTYLGVPLSILGFEIDFYSQSIRWWHWPKLLLQSIKRSFQPLPKFVVLEYGTDRPGDVAQLVAKLRPDVALLTLVAPAHVMNYPSLEAIAEDEGALVEAVPKNGAVFLNARDPYLARHRQRVKAETVTEVDEPNERIAVGFAAAVGRYFGCSDEVIAQALQKGHNAPHRFQRLTIGPWEVIDDTYNANPASMEAALQLLAKMPGRKVAILGTMRELGQSERVLHQQIGSLAHQIADVVIGVGELSEEYRPVVQFASSEEAARGVFSYLKKGDSILVKGSHSVSMEKIIEGIENATI